MTNSVEEILQRYVTEIKDKHIPDSIDLKQNIDEKIRHTNNWILEKTEQQKIKLRDSLTRTVKGFIWVQLIFFNIIVLLIVLSVTVKISWFKTIDNTLATLLFNFLKYYIGATIAELLGMLAFILHYVFSKNLSLSKFQKEKEDGK